MTIYTALITPFKDDCLDRERLIELIAEQKQAHIEGIVVLGSTAETPTLDEREKEEIIKLAVEHAEGMSVCVGCGASSTKVALENIQRAAELGADALLVAPPAYNRPPPAGLLAHFTTLADHSTIPLILYNIPQRAAVNLSVDLQLELAKHPQIVGVKESGDFQQISDLLMRRGEGYFVLAGDDGTALPLLALGAEGVVSVAANAFPDLIYEMVKQRSSSLLKELWPLLSALFCESNPIPIKAALEMMGKHAGDPRLPLVPLSDKGRALLTKALDRLCVR